MDRETQDREILPRPNKLEKKSPDGHYDRLDAAKIIFSQIKFNLFYLFTDGLFSYPEERPLKRRVSQLNLISLVWSFLYLYCGWQKSKFVEILNLLMNTQDDQITVERARNLISSECAETIKMKM